MSVSEPVFYVAWAVGAYLLGSLSIGDLVARAAGVEIRALGTGNPGAANMFREMGPKFGVSVFLLDIAKGAAATVPIYLLGLSTSASLLAVASVLTGHMFPVFWGFRGGTGRRNHRHTFRRGVCQAIAEHGLYGGAVFRGDDGGGWADAQRRLRSRRGPAHGRCDPCQGAGAVWTLVGAVSAFSRPPLHAPPWRVRRGPA